MIQGKGHGNSLYRGNISLVSKEGIETVARALKLSPGTLSHTLFNAIRERFSKLGPGEKTSADELVTTLWGQVGTDKIKGRKKQLSSLKTGLNRSLKKLAEAENPEGIMINRDNIFAVSEARKDKILNEIGIDFSNAGQIKNIISALRRGIAGMNDEELLTMGREITGLNQDLAAARGNTTAGPGDGSDADDIEEIELADDEEIVIEQRDRTDDEEDIEIITIADDEIAETEDGEDGTEIVEVDADGLKDGDGDNTGGNGYDVATGDEMDAYESEPGAGEEAEEVEIDEIEEVEVEEEDTELLEITGEETAPLIMAGTDIKDVGPDNIEEIMAQVIVEDGEEIIEIDEDELITADAGDENLSDGADATEGSGSGTTRGTDGSKDRSIAGDKNIFEILSQYLEPGDPDLVNGDILEEKEEYLARIVERFIPRFIHIRAEHDFYIGQYPVTNDLFAIFIHDTGYLTDAEAAGYGTVYQPRRRISTTGGNKRQMTINRGQTAGRVNGACWQFPNGPRGISAAANPDHPVTQVSVRDAAAFASWAGKRLPNETEWEAAGRGKDGAGYPWGNKYRKGMANLEDSMLGGCCPVNRFGPVSASPFGVRDLIGNCLEWVRNNDDTGPTHILKGGSWLNDHRCTLSWRRLPGEEWSNLTGFRLAVDG